MTLPIRIQRMRTKGWRAPAGTLYIGRHTSRRHDGESPFANPYSVAEYGRSEALARFRTYLATLPAWDLERRFAMLSTYDYLMCWCKASEACHGDVWLELLARRAKNQAALTLVDTWYATPDAQPPGTWEALEALIEAHPIDFGGREI